MQTERAENLQRFDTNPPTILETLRSSLPTMKHCAPLTQLDPDSQGCRMVLMLKLGVWIFSNDVSLMTEWTSLLLFSCALPPRPQLWVTPSPGGSGWKDGSHAVTNGSWWLAAVHSRIPGCNGAADCRGAGQKVQGSARFQQERRPTQAQGGPGGRQAAAAHLRRHPAGAGRDAPGGHRPLLLQEPEGEGSTRRLPCHDSSTKQLGFQLNQQK